MSDPAPPRPPIQGVWSLAWPTMSLFALQALVGVVDFAFVASLGGVPVASVGISTQIHFTVFSLLAGVSTGAVAVVARECGRGDLDQASRATRCAVALSTLFGSSLMLAIPFTERIVGLLGVEPAVAELGGACLAVLLLFNAPFAAGVALFESIRSSGDVRTPLVVGVIGNLVNVVGDYALIFGHFGAPELGAVGSAWATGLSNLVAVGLLGGLWLRGNLRLPPGRWRGSLTRAMSWRLMRVGLPTAAEQVSFHGGLLIFMGLVSSFGTPAITAYLIGVRVLAFCFVPGMGFAMAAATLVGQNLGAEQPERAARSGWRGMFGAITVMGIVGFAIMLLARPLAGVFGAAGQETVDLSVTFIWILGSAQPLMAIEFALGGALRGAGDTRFPFFTSMIGLFVMRLGGAFLVAEPFFGTITAVWMCLLADWGAKAALLALRFAAGRWREIDV